MRPHDFLEKREVYQGKFDTGDTAFLMLATGAVLLMACPGLSLLYAGLARRKSALSLIWLTFGAALVSIIQWFIWGYSLALSPTATNGFIGNLDRAGFRHAVEPQEDGAYPEIVYAMFMGAFQAVTCAILVGGFAERGRLMPAMVFIFIWSTLVYCPIACWAWSGNGWGAKWSVQDFAGGGVVEITSGVGGMVVSYFSKKRRQDLMVNYRPHNVAFVVIGTAFLLFGWLFFNAGSALGANIRAGYAIANSVLGAAIGAVTWVLMDYRLEGKYSMIAMSSGVISGLVYQTPASGFIPLWASFPGTIISTMCANFGTKVKYLIHIDDSMDTFAEHGIPGIVGLILNGFFASSYVIGLDGSSDMEGGFIDHNWKQLYKQLAYTCACIGWTVAITSLICFLMNLTPWLYLYAGEEAEERGIDDDQIGEFASDFIEVRREYLSAFPTAADPLMGPERKAPAENSRRHAEAPADIAKQPDSSCNSVTCGAEEVAAEEKTSHE